MNPLLETAPEDFFHIAPTSDWSFFRAFMFTSNILCLELRGTQRCDLQSHRLHQCKSENSTSTWLKNPSGRGWNKAFYLPFQWEGCSSGCGSRLLWADISDFPKTRGPWWAGWKHWGPRLKSALLLSRKPRVSLVVLKNPCSRSNGCSVIVKALSSPPFPRDQEKPRALACSRWGGCM